MALARGTRVGPYEISGTLGAGGMGEVYRARDTNLNRDVALKVLPDLFARDADRLARFKREAQMLASLSHPSIGVIYGLEEIPVDSKPSVSALVLELIEGETLADRIAAGPLPLDEALPIAQQIAEALQAAHDAGIVHRDLKPSNIKVRPDGTVKVLDFGLAKLMEGHPALAPGLADLSPTITSPAMTGLGVILGTAAYMSPEQARGKAVDKRTDVWAFGCVLYEMLTGRRAFDGEDATDTIASIVRGTPDWGALPPDVPAGIRLLLQRCLEKDRKQRIGDISTALFIMREATGFASPRDVAGVVAVPSRRPWRLVIWSTAAVVAAAVVSGLVTWARMRPERPPLRRLELTIAALPQAGQAPGQHIAITRDASSVVYVSAAASGVPSILVRPMNDLEWTTLAERAVQPFVSPNGEWVGYFSGADSMLKRVAITGGPPVDIARFTGNARGATWGEDDSIVFATANPSTGLERVSIAGGMPTELTKPAGGDGDHVLPRFLPGGHAILFTIAPRNSQGEAQIAVLDLRTPNAKPTILVHGGSDARYVNSGHLVYLAGTSLRAIAFDPERLKTSGTAVPVLTRLDTTNASGFVGEFDVASDGTLVYAADGVTGQAPRALVWVDRRGREEAIAAVPRAYLYPRLSWNGDRVAVDVRQDEDDIWTVDLKSGVPTRITKDPSLDRVPVWTRDDSHLIFGSARVGLSSIFAQASDGTGEAQQLTQGALAEYPTSVSPDGTTLLIHHGGGPQQGDILKLLLPAPLGPGRPSLDRAGTPAQPPSGTAPGAAPSLPAVSELVKTANGETNAEISPDQRWIVYQSNETGSFEIYISPYPDPNAAPRETVSKGGGMMPHFSRKGDELFYLTLDGTMMAVPLRPGKTWKEVAGTPAPVFDAKPYYYGDIGARPFRMYDVSQDGRRFLMIKPTETQSKAAVTPRLIVVENWFEELKRLVPVK